MDLDARVLFNGTSREVRWDGAEEFYGRATPIDGAVTIWDPTTLKKLNSNEFSSWGFLMDAMGLRSQKAQGLMTQITTPEKVRTGTTRVYIHASPRRVNGFIKVGVKKLFIRGDTGAMHEIDPLCVLDFYVHESCQRQGVGLYLFETMLQEERAAPHRLGYDKPSPKLLSFLAKYYGLKNYTPQANNFVVFKKYFESAPPSREGGGGGLASISQRPLTAAKAKVPAAAGSGPSPRQSPSSPNFNRSRAAIASPLQHRSPRAAASVSEILGSSSNAPRVVVYSPAKAQQQHQSAGDAGPLRGGAGHNARHFNDKANDVPSIHNPPPAPGGKGDLSRRPPSTLVLGDASAPSSHFQTSYSSSFGPLADGSQTSGAALDQIVRRAKLAQQAKGARSTRPW